MKNFAKIRKDFPMIENNKKIIFFDNASTSFKPNCVIESINNYYTKYSVNAQRGDYKLSYKVDECIEKCRQHVADFISAPNKEEIIFTSGATHSLNLAIRGFLKNLLNQGDQVLTTIAEHASCILPLMEITKETKSEIKYIPLANNGDFELENLKMLLDDKVKAIVIAQVSNVLGYEIPVKEICKIAHEKGVIVIVDGAQSVPHQPINVRDIDCDFLAFSCHKMCGPTGLGILYGKKKYLNKMNPIFFGGGSNVNYYENGEIYLKNIPYKFESGTMPIAEIIGFDKALSFLESIGMNEIRQYEEKLKKYAIKNLKKIEGINVYNEESLSPIITFNFKGMYAQDIGKWFDYNNICVRTGQHCSRLLSSLFGTNSTLRVSLYFYNTKSEIDYFIDICKKTSKENVYNHILK